MAKSNFLNEAIADAKQMKAAALANAKLALEESFSPTLQRMVSAKIQEDEGEDFEEPEIDIDINAGGEEDFGDEGGGEDTGFGSFEGGEDEASAEDEDVALESLIRELDGEEDEMMEGDDMEDDFMSEGEEEDWQDPNPEAIEEGEEDEMSDELSEALNALFEEEGLGDDLDMGPEKEDGSAYTDHSLPTNSALTERKRLRRENSNLKKKLNEAYQTVTFLKKTVNDINLLNAKLMYNTQLSRKFDLNEAQRSRIVDAIDRANSVREVKLVYTTICEAFNKKPVKKQMTEGSASRQIKTIKPTRTQSNVLNESMVDKFQRLANIKKFDDRY